MSLRWVIAGGGTGGHVTPALALGELLREAGESVLFVGSERGIENRLVPEAGFELIALDARPLIGRSLVARIQSIGALLRATWQARRVLARFGADIVISVGGYASAPAALAAATRGTPMVLVNTDARPGAANRLSARFAKRIFAGFPNSEDAFGSLAARVQVTGVPLRRALRDAFAGASQAQVPENGPRRLFVFGGSQGARQINDALLAMLPELAKRRVRIVHQTGEADRERVAEAYATAGIDACIVAFERDMPRRYQEAELVVCRAGAISIAELALAGRASLLVPLAHVGGGEQFANARLLEESGAARVLDTRKPDDAKFQRMLLDLLDDPAALRKMGDLAAKLGRPEAARSIIVACREIVGGLR
ncbi:MAG: undecaprenyldiphospho-muramoylpentapeptide beta-N-acetylglucosaminyltransferase [Deltaproteobacteria bacterium]|nr:undecaprenyldiphospho-muramoylpentapeptide beta-N-acetylglucosaminyltransferase [Deltaproteobacteria bacterium]MBW2361459.1 undecaprenyldiphospho-muramoylpentapeptide beta-N-acetylglucosaminyltransferase [Deltaproteobacteria bacterium]